MSKAAEQYRQAQAGLQPSSQRSQYLQMKIDDLAITK
jgi:predicted negative regulator of RcsB-dependent stress response